MSFATLIPPLISGAMPNDNPWPVFIFYGVYTLIGFLHIKVKLQESDGKTYMEIIKSFK